MKRINNYIYGGIILATVAIIITYYNNASYPDISGFLIGIEVICAVVLVMIYYKSRENTLIDEANTDRHTGLLVKTATQDKILKKIEKSSDDKYAFMIIDIDDFKTVNDSFGHEVGDKIIADIADIIKATFAEDSILGRIGGDEFVAFFEYAQSEDTIGKAESLQSQLHTYSNTNNYNIPVSVSIGIALFPQDGEDYKTLLDSADKKMYQVKKSGKNGYAI